MTIPNSYDCCILGAGIAGTTSALVLAQAGLRVLVIEAGQHPRFAIGESLVPTSTLGFAYLARIYGIPELRQISHYPSMLDSQLSGWPKLGFWFGHQREGQWIQPGNELMFLSPGLPMGPDVHMLRADVDGFLASRLADYGVDYTDRTVLADWQEGEDHDTLVLEKDGQTRAVTTRFMLDCSGHDSFLSKRMNLRESPTRLKTNTRAIFSHFRDVAFLEDIIGTPCARFGTRRDAGTVHHCFDGGWFWLIRFDNGTCSIGLVLDRRAYPDNNLPAEEEFRSFVKRFPTVAAQLARATAIRPMVKTGRLQFTSRRIFGKRYLLAPHASNFIDPLFSTGMDLTVVFIARMAPILAVLAEGKEVSAERLAALEVCHRTEIDGIDRIVHGMLCSFRNADIFKQYWRSWIHASLIQYFMQLSSDPPITGFFPHYGASLPSWNGHMEAIYRAVATDDVANDAALAQFIKSTMDGVPELSDKQQSNWQIGSSEACCPLIRPQDSTAWFENLVANDPVLAAHTSLELLDQSRQRFRNAETELARRYQQSVTEGTPYHRGVDFIRSQQF
jgi:FADH2 O2-dependent halogenase